jgi:hypothetical protein
MTRSIVLEAFDGPAVAMRKSTAEEARRLRRQADAYDELLLRRLAERGEPPADFEREVELPGDERVLIDTALYHAAAERTARARALVRRERLVLGGLAVAAL